MCHIIRVECGPIVDTSDHNTKLMVESDLIINMSNSIHNFGHWVGPRIGIHVESCKPDQSGDFPSLEMIT